MTVGGLAVAGYQYDPEQLSIILAASSAEEALGVCGSRITIKDGVGNDFLIFENFNTVQAVTYNPVDKLYTVVLLHDSPDAATLSRLEAENRQLKAQVKAAQESNAMLEECVVEMAGIVYA